MKPKKYYTVRAWKNVWIYDTRDDCKAQVHGFTGAKYKSFPSFQLAEQALNNPYQEQITPKAKMDILSDNVPFVKNSISVDAACSGNPGLMEYRAIDMQNGKVLFHEKFNTWTNNIGEFLAIVHWLSFLQDKKNNQDSIYTDSRIAMSRVKHKKCKTKLKKEKWSEELFKIIKRAEEWLETHSHSNKIIKWDTKTWGEIPADFGRK